MSTKTTNTHKAFKSAISGKFVTKQYAQSHPKTTFKETVRNPNTRVKKK